MRERLEARPEADDVAEPVDGRTDRCGEVPAPGEEAAENVDRVEPLRKPLAPAGLAVEPLAVGDRPQRSGEADRHRDRPRQREQRRRLGDAHHEQRDRCDAGGRSEERVFECAQSEHAHARLAIRDAGLAERVQIDSEAALGDERAEPRCDRGERVAHRHVGSLVDPRHLPIAEDVADVGDQLGAERDEEPDRLDGVHTRRDVTEAGRRGDREERAERDCRARNHEHERLRSRPFQMGSPCELPDRHANVPLPVPPLTTRERMVW